MNSGMAESTESDTAEGDPLEDLITEAAEERGKFIEARDRLQEVRARLFEHVDDLYTEGVIDKEERSRLDTLIEDREYERVRDAIREAREGGLAFDDEDKAQFAAMFGDSWAEMNATAEAVATAMLEFEGAGMDESDMVDYLYGKHASLRKGDIQAVFDAFDAVPQGRLSTKEMARLLAAFNREMNIEPTVDVLEAIQAEAP